MFDFDVAQPAYIALRDIISERTNSVIIWTGSGLSAPADIPTWSGLREFLVSQLLEKATTFENPEQKRLTSLALNAQRHPNLWVAFGILRDGLGETSYKAAIREKLRPASSVAVPKNYLNVWRLPIAGMLNLNIDRLATRAFSQVRSQEVTEFSADRAGTLMHVLSGTRPFILNLHGSHEDSESWVFTDRDLTNLLSQDAYTMFVQTCLVSNTNLFVGLTADDTAVGGHLKRLAEKGAVVGTHYWLTDRRDRDTDTWAEQNGIRVIRYKSDGHNHQAVDGFFADILNYLPVEPADGPPVLLGPTSAAKSLPPVEELRGLEANEVRKLLNAEANRILEPGTESAFAEYRQFCDEYDEAIYRSWYISTTPGKNALMDYVLDYEVAAGAFGRVYSAYDASGDRVAIKVLLNEIRSKPELLQSFRRGIRSMRILNNHDIQKMVAFQAASEIPAFVVMEWVDGPSLRDAVLGKQIDTWELFLKIGRDLSKVLRSAHILAERVLHRDVRPTNVMLRNFFDPSADWELVVLDFDLSWHLGAIEESVTHGSTAFGYLAPEQTRRIEGVSTRHASVDSFGVGMTLFFVLTGQDPPPLNHLHESWHSDIERATQRFQAPAWKSIPQRVNRLIHTATRDKQSERWDMTQIHNELAALYAAEIGPQSVLSCELICEEFAARCHDIAPYAWDTDRLKATLGFVSGISLEILAREVENYVQIDVSWISQGEHDRKRVGRAIGPAVDQATQVLRAAGWQPTHVDKTTNTRLSISARCGAGNLLRDFDKYVVSVDRLVSVLQF